MSELHHRLIAFIVKVATGCSNYSIDLIYSSIIVALSQTNKGEIFLTNQSAPIFTTSNEDKSASLMNSGVSEGYFSAYSNQGYGSFFLIA